MNLGYYALGLGVVFCEIASILQSIRLRNMSYEDYIDTLDMIEASARLRPQLVSLVIVLFIAKDAVVAFWVSWALVLVPFSWLWYIGVAVLFWHLRSLMRNIKSVSFFGDFDKSHVNIPTPGVVMFGVAADIISVGWMIRALLTIQKGELLLLPALCWRGIY